MAFFCPRWFDGDYQWLYLIGFWMNVTHWNRFVQKLGFSNIEPLEVGDLMMMDNVLHWSSNFLFSAWDGIVRMSKVQR